MTSFSTLLIIAIFFNFICAAPYYEFFEIIPSTQAPSKPKLSQEACNRRLLQLVLSVCHSAAECHKQFGKNACDGEPSVEEIRDVCCPKL